ncbi:hypothetical protein M3Y97_00734500 [Aphelenchoides bicaudatus]|nr:hypothetical protein M3Y97_00734500 [Aphelenchoides bicaudatus]
MAKRRTKKPRRDANQSEPSTGYVSAYKRAEQKLATIQTERKQKAANRKKANEEKDRKLEENLSYRRRMNKALKQRTKKGQPKLNAQMEILLEKIQKRVGKKR